MDQKFEKSGIVLVNKPAGISSNKVVNIVKHKLNAKKCGHLGTLDLEGEGLLPVTVNNATKLFDLFLNKVKTYETVFVFGIETDTLDFAGQVLKEVECDISQEQVEEAISKMVGKYAQMPPMYSAKKVGGKVAYKEARKGATIELKPKEIEIFSFKLLQKLKKNTFRFEITCSSGTYIRSVCRDLAYNMSTYGSMQCILRTKCGGFNLKDANTMEDVDNGKIKLISCEKVFDNEKFYIEKTAVEKLLNGQILKIQKSDGQYRLLCGNDFVGLGEVSNGLLKLKIRLI